jgi:hypothetical protein
MATPEVRTSANISDNEQVAWHLPIIRKEHLQEARQAAQDLSGILGDNFFSSMLAPAGSTTENITQFCARGLTAKELVLRLSAIKEAKVRDALAEKILPYVVSSTETDLAQHFNISFNNDILGQLNDLDDEKGDVAEEGQSLEKSATRWTIEVYYAKALFKRVGKKHYLVAAYYSTKISLPFYSLAAFFKTQKKLQRTLNASSMLAFNKLHREMQFAWPNMIHLYESAAPPADQDLDEKTLPMSANVNE